MFDGGFGGLTLEAVAAAPPDPALLQALAALDPGTLDDDDRLYLLQSLDKASAWLAATQARVLASLAARPVQGDDDWCREEVAAALNLSPSTAAQRLDIARDLVFRLPGTCAALTRGDIGYWHATTISDATKSLDDAAAAAVEERILPHAPGKTISELRRTLRRAVLAADPTQAQEARRRAQADRRVQMWPLPDGMAELRALLPAEGAMTVYTALDALAHRAPVPGDDRVMDQRRADALIAMAMRALDDPSLPETHGRYPHIQVTISAATLLGGHAPGELAGYGPITAPTARAIAAHGTWRRLLTDPTTGELLDYGRTVYRPPADLAHFVIARDQTCRFPGCQQPGWYCDLDHATPWDAGGPTNPANCGCLCRRHHRMKTQRVWQLERRPDGVCVWTSHTGRTHITRPPGYP